MDGNGRWAQKRGLPRTAGHVKGIANVKKITIAARDLGVKILTLFAFSTENWSRPASEIKLLMREFDKYLTREMSSFIKDKIRLNVMGRKNPFSDKLWERIQYVQDQTKKDYNFILNLAVNYGGRAEIVDAAKKIASDFKQGSIDIDDLNEDKFREYLYFPEVPDPDLLIRTSGELRISNFLVWELAYSEFYFIKKFWPDFNPKDLELAISEYAKRDRRYGVVKSA